MLARFQRGARVGLVEVVVQAHIHRVDILPLQHFERIMVDVGDVETFLHPFGLGLIDVGKGHNVDAVDLAVVLQVVFADLAHANHADPSALFRRHGYLLLEK